MNLVIADATLGNDSVLAGAMFDLLKNTRELEYMAHQFHWNIIGVKFNTMHEFYEEEYKQLFEDQDEIAEQIRQQGFFVPVINNVLLEENYSASGFEEQLIAYSGKLAQNMTLIDKVNDLAKNEIAVQDLCARLKGLRSLTLNLKVKAMLSANKMSLEPSEATASADEFVVYVGDEVVTMKPMSFEKAKEVADKLKKQGKKEVDIYDVLKGKLVTAAAEETPLLEKILRSWASKKGYKVNKWNHGTNVQLDILPSDFNKTTDKEYENSVLFVIQVDEKDEVARVKTKSFGDSLCNLDLNAIGTTPTRKLNTILDSFIPDTDYWGHLVYRPYPLYRKLQTERKIAKATAAAITTGKLDKSDEIAKIDKFLSNLAKKYKVADIEKGRDFGTNPTTSFDWHLYKHSRIKPNGIDNTKIDVIYNAGDITISAHKGYTGNGNIRQKAKIHSVKTLERYAEEFAKWAFSDNSTASSVTAGFDKGRYKEIDEESKFFKILKNDCDIRPKNFYAINKGLRLAIKVIKGTFEEASIRFFALKNKGGYIRVELKDKVYIVGYTVYDSGKIKVWTRELKNNVPVNSFDYDMLNMYAKPFGTKMITGMLPTWMSI